MRYSLSLISVILIFLTSHRTSGQVTNYPVSFQQPNIFNKQFFDNLPAYKLPLLDNNQLRNYADSVALSGCIECNGRNYYGFGINSSIDLKSTAQYHNASINGGQLWLLKISSQSALGLQFYFSQFDLPNDAFLHIYTTNRQNVTGPYNNSNYEDGDPNQIQKYGTAPIKNGEVILEYFEGSTSNYSGQIVISNIIHLFSAITPGYGTSAWCQKDVACQGSFSQMASSVALMLNYDQNSNLAGSCSGALINNATQDGTPYFLTAAHCVNDNTLNTLNSTIFIFDYQVDNCGSTTEPVFTKVFTGATMLSRDLLSDCNEPKNSDYALLKLLAPKEQVMNSNICYAGWDISDLLNSNNTFQDYTMIHHPSGDIKKISQGTNLTPYSNDIPLCNTQQVNSAENFYNLDITYGGGGEPGSSGSPIFYNGRIACMLNGGKQSAINTPTDACNPATYELFLGRFNKQWVQGNLSQWLDPNNLTDINNGPFTINQWCPNNSSNNPPNITYQTIGDGFLINNNAGSPAVMCNSDDIYLFPDQEQRFHIDDYTKRVDCGDIDISNPMAPDYNYCFRSNILNGFKCYCTFYSFNVTVQELNFYLTPIGPTWNKTFEYKTSPGSSIPYYLFKASDMGLTLQPGKVYKITIGAIVNGSYVSSSSNVYILDQNLNISNVQVNTLQLYSTNNITIQNSSVVVDAKIACPNQISVLPESSLLAGHYFIRSVDCNQFRLMNPNLPTTENETVIAQTNLTKNKIYTHKETPDKAIIFPNPNNGNLKIKTNKSISSFTVLNSYGTIVLRNDNVSNSEVDIKLDKNSPKGIYLLQVKYESKEYNSETYKFIVE